MGKSSKIESQPGVPELILFRLPSSANDLQKRERPAGSRNAGRFPRAPLFEEEALWSVFGE